MNKRLLLCNVMIVVICLATLSYSSGPPYWMISSTPITKAKVGEKYSYDVNVSYASGMTYTFSLIKSLSGMSIDSITGVIEWIPDNIYSGGDVLVMANSENFWKICQQFRIYIYTTDSVSCPESIAAYWKLDEYKYESSVYADYYGANNALVEGNAPSRTSGKVNYAQGFHPLNNSRLFVPKDPVFNWGSDDDFSIEFWYYRNITGVDSTGVMVGKNEGSSGVQWSIGINHEERINFNIRKSDSGYSQCTSDSVGPGWNHVAAVRNSQTDYIYLYINSELQDSALYDGSGFGLVSDSIMTIGWMKPGPGDNGATYPLYGGLDELIIHNTALTDTEINKSYLKGLNGCPACKEGNSVPQFTKTPQGIISEDKAYSYYYAATDPDGDLLTYEILQKPAWLFNNAEAKKLEGTPSINDTGTYSVSIKAYDEYGDTIVQNFTITVNCVNDKPVLSSLESTDLAYYEEDGQVAITSTLDISDEDDTILDSARIWFSKNYQVGEDLLTFLNTDSLSGEWNAEAGSLKLTGMATLAHYQKAIRTVTYENTNTDKPDTLIRTICITVNDGEVNSETVNRNITIIPVNDCPVILGHDLVIVPEDNSILIRLNHISVSDADDDLNHISLFIDSGTNYIYAGNIVTPDLNFHDTLCVNITVTDKKCSVKYVLPVIVESVNDMPVLSNLEPGPLVYDEDDGKVAVTETIAISDTDDVKLDSAMIWISVNYHAEEDVLAFSSTASITGTWDAANGSLKLTGSATKEDYRNALRSVMYENTNIANPDTHMRVINIMVNDGDLNSADVTRYILVEPKNDYPEIFGHSMLASPEDDTILIQLQHLLINDVDNSINEITVSVVDGRNYSHAGNVVRPDTNFYDTLFINIQVNDLLDSVKYILPVYIIPVNDVPFYNFTEPPLAYEGQFYHFALSADDKDDSDLLNFTALEKPSWLQLTDNLLIGKPRYENVGKNPVKIRLTDGKVNIDTTFIITVKSTNHKPFISSKPKTTVNEGEEYIYYVEYQDEDTHDILILYTDLIPCWLRYDYNHNKLYGRTGSSHDCYKSDSTYMVQLRISDTKQDSTQTFFITINSLSGISEADVSESLKVIPNPASDFIKFESDLTGMLNIEIIDITGKTVYNDNVRLKDNPFEISTSNMPNGLYFYKVYNNTEHFVGSIIIKR